MLVIPAIDIMDGEAVQLVGGDPQTAKRYGDPYEVALRFADAGARRLHFVDLDTAMERDRGGGARASMERLVDEVKFNSEVQVQVGGGIRDAGSVARVLDFADFAILGTRAVEDAAFLAAAARRHPGRLIVAVDMRGAQLMVRGWRSPAKTGLPELTATLRALPMEAVLHTRLEIEGRLTGVGEDIVRSSQEMLAPAGKRIIWAGGIAHLKDIATLAEAGMHGAVVGSALYEGTLDLEEALRQRPRA